MTTIVPVSDTGVPKGAIIDLAFEDCRLSGFDFDRTPEENLTALRRLNAKMAEWPWNALGYAFPSSGEGSSEELSNIPFDATAGVSKLLAMELMSAFGKSIPDSFRASAVSSINYVRSKCACVPTIGYAPGTIRGRGARGSMGNHSPYYLSGE